MKILGVVPWVSLIEMGQWKTLALGRLGLLVRRCPVLKMLVIRGRKGREVSRGQRHVRRRLEKERRGLVEAYARD